MNSATITIKKDKKAENFLLEINVDKFESLAARFGFFNPDFLEILKESEEDVKKGRIKKIISLKDIA